MNENITITPDIIKDLPETERDKIDRIIEQNKKRIIESTERDADKLRKYIKVNSNPNPLMIALYVFITIIIVYIIYHSFMKPRLNGKWIDNRGSIYIMNQNMFSDIVDINYIDNNTNKNINGLIQANILYIGKKIGIWDYKDKIILVGGGEIIRYTNN